MNDSVGEMYVHGGGHRAGQRFKKQSYMSWEAFRPEMVGRFNGRLNRFAGDLDLRRRGKDLETTKTRVPLSGIAVVCVVCIR